MEVSRLARPSIFSSLQWGRGGWPADGRLKLHKRPNKGAASMGPRGLARGWRRSRGSPAKSCRRFNGAAGVGPRMVARSPTSTTCSQGFNGAAGVGPRMGHEGGQSPETGRGFNGAAGVCPRMAPLSSQIGNLAQALQWGRGGLPADGGVKAEAIPWPIPMLQWGRGGLPADGCVYLEQAKQEQMLQWGRGGLPADGRHHYYRPFFVLCASMGPRGFARGWLFHRVRD